MANLPSRYIPAEFVSVTSGTAGFNTGLVPKSTMQVYLVAHASSATYVFGARNSNSNTSAGQLNLYLGNPSNIGWKATRNSISGNALNDGFIDRFDIFENDMALNIGNSQNTFLQKDGTDWTGTRPMYLLAMNNAGALSATANAYPVIYTCKIYDNGLLVGEYVPVWDTEKNAFTFYDTVTQSALPKVGTGTIGGNLSTIRVHASEGGHAYIDHLGMGLVDSLKGNNAHLVAVPNDGYSLVGWTDQSGNEVLLGADGLYSLPAISAREYDLYANFERVTEVDAGARLQAAAFPTGYTQRDEYLVYKDMVFMDVVSASVKEDLLQRTTSTITVRSIPSTLLLHVPIMLYDAKGRMVYVGIVDSIEGNVIYAREFLSIYDFDALQNASASVSPNPSTELVAYALARLVRLYSTNLNDSTPTVLGNLIEKRFTNRIDLRHDRWSFLKESTPNRAEVTYPVVQKGVINVESLIMQMFEMYQVSIRTRPALFPPSTNYSDRFYRMLKPICADKGYYSQIVLGSNSEAISNVNVTTETAETTYLIVYNSAGTTLRGVFSVDWDGNVVDITNVPVQQLPRMNVVAYDLTKEKMVMSDDKLSNITAENLSSALYNHKITLEVDLGGMYRLEDFQLGQPVLFYDGANRFITVLSAWEFSMDSEGVKKIKLTLGKVRTSLTSKINRGR